MPHHSNDDDNDDTVQHSPDEWFISIPIDEGASSITTMSSPVGTVVVVIEPLSNDAAAVIVPPEIVNVIIEVRSTSAGSNARAVVVASDPTAHGWHGIIDNTDDTDGVPVMHIVGVPDR